MTSPKVVKTTNSHRQDYNFNFLHPLSFLHTTEDVILERHIINLTYFVSHASCAV